MGFLSNLLPKEDKFYVLMRALSDQAQSGTLLLKDFMEARDGAARDAAGQKIALQRNGFGEVVAEYASGVDGEVAGLRSDAMAEPGDPLAFLLFHKATPDDGETYPE